MNNSGKLERIWIKRFKRGLMDSQNSVRIKSGVGLEGNANQGGKRQITIISLDAWEKNTASLQAGIDPSLRRANLLVSGVELANSRGRTLQIGACRIKIWGETRPCNIMDEAFDGLKEALETGWGGGVFGEALNDGIISTNDEVCWLQEA